jgi:hypothetical protein
MGTYTGMEMDADTRWTLPVEMGLATDVDMAIDSTDKNVNSDRGHGHLQDKTKILAKFNIIRIFGNQKPFRNNDKGKLKLSTNFNREESTLSVLFNMASWDSPNSLKRKFMVPVLIILFANNLHSH